MTPTPAQRRGSLYVEKWGEGREASRKEGGKKYPLPVWPSPRPLRHPPITLARMSMVVQVSISCMDTGVCPSALASRISTSCSAFSLNVSIKLTKELRKQHRHQRPLGPAQGCGHPVPPFLKGDQCAEWRWGPLPAFLVSP